MISTAVVSLIGLYGFSSIYTRLKKVLYPSQRIQYYFITENERIPWIEREYNEFELDQILFISIDPDRNKHFRNKGVIAITGVDPKDNTEFFYVILNKED